MDPAGSEFPPTSPTHQFQSDVKSAKTNDGPVAKNNLPLQYSDTIPKPTTTGFTIRSEVKRMYDEGIFASDDGVELHRSMFIESDIDRRIKVPDTFSEKSRYRNAFKCVAMSITDSQFKTLGDGGMTTEELTKLAATMSKQVALKLNGLENEYNIRSQNTKGRVQTKDTINAVGRRFLVLYKAMVNMVGEAKANQTIAKLSGVGKGRGGKSQTLLGDTFPSTKNKKTG